jgi:hypothetical protein
MFSPLGTKRNLSTMFHIRCVNYICQVCQRPTECTSILGYTHRTPSRTLSQLEKYNFSGESNNHRPERCNRIKRTTLLPSRGNFRKQTCDAIPLGRYVLRHTSCGHNSKWAFFELWQCSYRGAIYWIKTHYKIEVQFVGRWYILQTVICRI